MEPSINPHSLLTDVFRLQPRQRLALDRLGLKTARDLLYYFPNRYEAAGQIKKISQLAAGDLVTLYGQVGAPKISKAWHKKIPIGELSISDETGSIKAVWYHQVYLAKKVPPGHLARLRGKVSERKGKIYLANPEIELAQGGPVGNLFSVDGVAPDFIPIYPESRGLTSGWFYYHIQKIIGAGVAEQLVDPLPADLVKKYHLPSLKAALVWSHSPKNLKDSEAGRKRFAFEEIFFIQLTRLQEKVDYKANSTFEVRSEKLEVRKFLDRFPFKPTTAQTKAISQILDDFESGQPMTRLLEGDVGSGKTLVAAATALAIVQSGYEVAYMAPTEILAKQHFDSFIQYFNHLPIQIGLITGSGCYKFPSKISHLSYTHISRSQLLKWVATGQIPILIGTHALIQKTVKFKNLAYVIIDEQHRFGVMQRSKLVRKHERVPHLLSMTATPIPRTLALTIYGDLDLTLLDEMPVGRRAVITEVVSEAGRAGVYEKIRGEIKLGRQAYVICPRIDEPDPTKELALQVKSAKAEQKMLQTKIFPELTVGLIHSKMKTTDKDEVMADFATGQIDILVATSVVEVGVNVPNATLIVIEGAERFGLAQLHQLRGRVLRSNHQAYCFLLTTSGKTASERLKAIVTAKNGFELAEMDLKLRGAGSLSGDAQWGLTDVGMEAIKNLKLVEAARTEAANLLKTDPALKKHPLISERLAQQKTNLHFE